MAKTKRMMNKPLILMILFACCGVVQAQDLKGKKSIGLNFYIQHLDQKRDTIRSLERAQLSGKLNFAYFLNKNRQVGVGVGFFGVNSSNLPHRTKFFVRSISIEAFLRQHYWLAKNIAMFIEPSITYNRIIMEDNQKSTPLQISKISRRNAVYLNNRVGFLWMVGQRFGVDASFLFGNLGYNIDNTKTKYIENDVVDIEHTKQTFAYFSLNSNTQGLHPLSVGFRYLF
ncbi:MAG TPA: hypothetical protein DCS93_17005 [Microscillaceae bacterium]|nr:hypothetical protein [Microscillaceae bacterium]